MTAVSSASERGIVFVATPSWKSVQDGSYECKQRAFASFVLSVKDGDWGVKWAKCPLSKVTKTIDI